MKRIPDFDGLRFVLCLGIAIFHYSYRVPVKNELLQNTILTFSYFTDIFFIVSGLFLARRRNYVWNWREYLGFLGKRLARLYPLHVAAFSCFAILSILTAKGIIHPSTPPNMNWRDGLAQLLLIHDWGVGKTFSYNYVSWSLSALLMMYLAFPLFDFLLKRLGNAFLLLVVMALFGADALAQWLGTPSVTRVHFADLGIFRALPSFLFGMWVARVSEVRLSGWMVKSGLLVCLIIFLFYHPHDSVLGTMTLEGPWRLGFLYCFTYLLYAATMQNIYTPLRWSFFVNNARYSFAIFVLHPLVGLFFFNAVPAHWGQTTLSALLLVSAGVAVSILTAILAYHLYENPMQRWLVERLNRWLNRQNAQTRLVSDRGSA